MKQDEVVNILSAVANGFRLDVLRHIVQNGETGVQPGSLADFFGVTKSNISFHLMQLLNAGLIHQRREGQYHYYTANAGRLKNAAAYLVADIGNASSLPVLAERPSNTETSAESVVRQAHALTEKTNEMNLVFMNMLVDELVNYMDAEKTLLAEGKLSRRNAEELRRDIVRRLKQFDDVPPDGKHVLTALAFPES